MLRVEHNGWKSLCSRANLFPGQHLAPDSSFLQFASCWHEGKRELLSSFSAWIQLVKEKLLEVNVMHSGKMQMFALCQVLPATAQIRGWHWGDGDTTWPEVTHSRTFFPYTNTWGGQKKDEKGSYSAGIPPSAAGKLMHGVTE